MKLSRTLTSHLGVAFTLLLPLITQSAHANDRTVVPGERVGKVKLGALRSQVRKFLGKPTTSTRWKTGQQQDTWLGAKPPLDKWGTEVRPRSELNVIYEAKKADPRVIQIEFNSPTFQTTRGFSISSTLADFRKYYPGVKTKAFGYEDPGGGGYMGYYFDNQKQGIAMSFGTQDYFDARANPELIRVHRKGVAVLPDPGGEPDRATDELPIGKIP